MSNKKFLLSRGEEGNRRGTEFEDAVVYLLGRMGYEVIDQNFNIECSCKSEHKKNEHGIDILIKKPFKNYFPFRIPNHQTIIVSCKAVEGGKIEEGEVTNLINSIDCYKKYSEEKDVGGILITTGNFGQSAYRKFFENCEVKGWDLKYIIFLSVLVSNYGGIIIKRLFVDDFTYIVYNPIFGFPFPRDLIIFYDAETPLNVEKIKRIIRNFSHKFSTKLGLYVHIEFHSLSGFTADVYDYFEKQAWRFNGLSFFNINPQLFISYMFPWEVILKFDLIYSSHFFGGYKNIKLK